MIINKTPAAGSILLSEPFMPDEHFKRSVVFLCEHREDGSVGFILNKPLGIKLSDAVDDFPDFDAELYLGGPVQTDTLHYIHRLGPQIEGSIEIAEGLFWGGNFEVIKLMIENGEVQPSDFKFFLGYSGWGPQQLSQEMEEKSWIVAKGEIDEILSVDPNDMWKNVLKNLGGEFRIMANFPENPSLN